MRNNPRKKIGNRRVSKYSFEIDEPQFGETTEIRIKVVDKYKKESVSDNEFDIMIKIIILFFYIFLFVSFFF